MSAARQTQRDRPPPLSLDAERGDLAGVWPLGINHSTSKLEKSERARRRNENDNRLLAEFSSLVVNYCEASKLDHAQRAEFSHDILGFLHEK
jgi:hypothetical protein